MLIIISYDIQNDRTRARLAKKLKDFGPRVQKSVFEADIKPLELKALKNMLNRVTLQKEDTIRVYILCQACREKVMIWGSGEVTKDKDWYIV